MADERMTQEHLTGTWQAVYSEVNGELASVAHTGIIRHIYVANRFQVSLEEEIVHEGTYSLSDKTTPHQITFVYTKSSHFELNKPRVGIIQLVGNTSKICLGEVGAHAPTGFNTVSRSNTTLIVLQKHGFEAGRSIKELAAITTKSTLW